MIKIAINSNIIDIRMPKIECFCIDFLNVPRNTYDLSAYAIFFKLIQSIISKLLNIIR